MHKNFYASGFLYNPYSQQILLQQQALSTTLFSPWLFGGFYKEKEAPEIIFKNIIFDLLDIRIDAVYPVYSYFNENTSTNQIIVYSELKVFQNFSSKNGIAFVWFSFKDVAKLHIAEQIKHDIVVGQRVIDAALRKQRGEHSF